MKLFTHRINRIAVRLALFWFASGNLTFLLALIIPINQMEEFGILFLLSFIGINTILLFILLMNTLIHFKTIQEHALTILLVLLNIPIALLYFNFLISV